MPSTGTNEVNNDLDKCSTVYSNAFRISFTETEFTIDFGFVKPEIEKQDDNIKIVSSVALPPERIETIILSLLKAAIDFEEQFDKNIGFKPMRESRKANND